MGAHLRKRRTAFTVGVLLILLSHAPQLFAQKLTAFARAGVQRVFIWPVADEVRQLERFWNEVRPLVAAT